jgi:outer membrane receptor protein involved in Fe transport
MNTTLTYLEGPLSVSFNWRYLPHTHSAAYPLYQTSAAGLSECGPNIFGNPSSTAPSTVSCTKDTASYNIFDLSATYTIMRNYTLRFGVDNIFDKQPPTTAANTGVGQKTDGTYLPGGSLASDGVGGFGAGTNPSLYDALGRRFYIGINAKF